MRFELVVFSTVFALLGASMLLTPRSNRVRNTARPSPRPPQRNSQRHSQRPFSPELERLMQPYLLFRTSASVARC